GRSSTVVGDGRPSPADSTLGGVPRGSPGGGPARRRPRPTPPRNHQRHAATEQDEGGQRDSDGDGRTVGPVPAAVSQRCELRGGTATGDPFERAVRRGAGCRGRGSDRGNGRRPAGGVTRGRPGARGRGA